MWMRFVKSDLFKRFMKEEDGLGTVEIIIIIAVLVAIALLFRKTIIDFVTNMMNQMFPKTDTLTDSDGDGVPNSTDKFPDDKTKQ